jgi:2-polyprenyl-3-methyl-5-hydroxy-6-metoxy-1,4-benzoquinol methylase
MIRRIKRGGDSSVVRHLKRNGTVLTSLISEELGSTIGRNSSLENCLRSFQTIKERKCLDFSTDGSEQYNSLLTMRELRHTLNSSHGTAVGPDKIHYQFLQNLSKSARRLLLRMKPQLEATYMDLVVLAPCHVLELPPWSVRRPLVIL